MANANGFRKGQEATYIANWDHKGTFGFCQVIVYSCGKRQMVLTDAVTGEEIGTHFEPTAATRDTFNVGRRAGTFARMDEAEAEATCKVLAADFIARERAGYETRIAKSPENPGYIKVCRERIAELHEPRAINLTGKYTRK